MKFRNKNYSKGFTLIELMVVISIISLLSSLIFASLSTSRAKGRDALRMQTLRQYEKALASYYAVNNSYPTTSGTWRGRQTTAGCGTIASSFFIPGLNPTYIKDGSGPYPGGIWDPNYSAVGCYYGYLYISDGVGYKLLSSMLPETVFPVLPESPFYDPARFTYALSLCEGTTACAY